MNIRHDNRKVTFSDTYNAKYSLSPKNQIVKDNKICVKIKDVTREISNIEVFNFEVKDDNSYTVNNDIVHNCQDISTAGKQKGFVDEHGNSTRSGLFFEALRIIKDIKPKYAIAENVKALTSKKFTSEFQTVLTSLNNVGYNNYYKVLNAKDYGIPQNRERIFIISIRKDIDDGFFVFPNPVPLRTRLKDLLETNVDERYYLTDDQVKRITTSNYMQNKRRIQEKDISDTLCARDWKDPKCVRAATDTAKVMQVENLRQGNGWDNPQCGRVYDTNGLSPTLNTMQGGDRQPKIVERAHEFRIRKLTPLECWRLMGFEDTDFWKVKNSGISNSQLYKMAGNSIVVNVLRAIFRELLNEQRHFI